MSIGARIKEERERLGYNQTQFAAAVEASKKTQMRWEQDGGAYPNASQLATWRELGLDVLYVLTGEKPSTPASAHLPADEQVLLEAYRSLAAPARTALLADLLSGSKSSVKARLGTRDTSTVSVVGNGNRAAGRDFNE